MPRNLRFATNRGRQFSLRWEGLGNEALYNVYQAASRYGQYVKLNDTPLDNRNFVIPADSMDYYKVTAVTPTGESSATDAISQEMQFWGENVYIFSPQDDPAQVMAHIDAIWAVQETNHFGKTRFAYFFKPGVYDDAINVKIGFFTTAQGLGFLPADTTIQKLTCDARWLSGPDNHNATCNFWRGAENLGVNSDTLWAVSQAVSLRRMDIQGDLYLHDDRGWGSGGFLADSRISGVVDAGSQQQWLSRNNTWKSWNDGSWNIVFVGIVDEQIPPGQWPQQRYTTQSHAPVVKEKPFVVYDAAKGYGVFAPALRRDCQGTSWESGTEGTFYPIHDFYIAKASGDTAGTINTAIENGKHILFTPGVYNIDIPIEVHGENRIILGLGMATIVSCNGNPCMNVADDSGIVIGGLLFDAGVKRADVLLEVGTPHCKNNHADNPILLSDLYFRVGGENPAGAAVDVCAIIHSHHVIGDNFWVWRADHGAGVGWDKNPSRNGLIINGNDVTFYALMCEHFQEYQTIWNGERGRNYFYQSEIPYDVPNQDVWKSHNGRVNGYASYKVGGHVQAHYTMGLGVYSVNRAAEVDLHSAIEVPNAPGVEVVNACSLMITGYPGISHVVNDSGEAAITPGARRDVLYYCNGVARVG
ncbi:MAG: sialidase [Defluviitaleaceae bacterium]|nr:sialidase [Defluviitaleaceae bacterium]